MKSLIRGNLVVRTTEEVIMEAGDSLTVDQDFQVDDPRLWSPGHRLP